MLSSFTWDMRGSKMWTYEQSSGRLFNPHGIFISQGYSGGGIDPTNLEAIKAKNNPLMQFVHDLGPTPCGYYTMKAPVDSVTHGRYVIELVPDVGNEMYGRDAFRIHGDSIPHPGFASEGCIIQNYPTRVKIWSSGDHRLQVVRHFDPLTQV